MPVWLVVLCIFTISWMSLSPNRVHGQDYPRKPIRMVSSEPGGNAEITARIIAQGISAKLGQPIVIDNRPNGIVPFEIVHKAPPDGYTLLVYNNTVWLLPLMQNVSYDPVTGFVPVTLATTAPNIVVVYPSLPVKSIKDLIALAKAKPGELNFAITGLGSGSHLAAELFKAMAGVDMVGVTYKGSGPAFTDLVAGRVHTRFAAAASVTPFVTSGKLRALAVTSAAPSALAPGLPTVAASGLPGYEIVYRTGVFAPARTPAAVINRLNQEIVRFIKTPAASEKFSSVGVETVGSSPQEFAAKIKEEMATMGKIIKDANIKAY